MGLDWKENLEFVVKTKRNSTQIKTTLKQLALELDTVARCSTTPPTPPPQTSQPLLDQLESWNLAQTLIALGFDN